MGQPKGYLWWILITFYYVTQVTRMSPILRKESFWMDIFVKWCQINYKPYRISNSQIQKKPLWFNSLIKCNIPSWYNHGTLYEICLRLNNQWEVGQPQRIIGNIQCKYKILGFSNGIELHTPSLEGLPRDLIKMDIILNI